MLAILLRQGQSRKTRLGHGGKHGPGGSPGSTWFPARWTVRHVPGGCHASFDRVRRHRTAGSGRMSGRGAGRSDLLRSRSPRWISATVRATRPVAYHALLEQFDHVVVPSWSCAAAIRAHYRELFNNDPAWHARAEAVAGCTYELLSYLVDIRGSLPEPVARFATATYHDSCSGLREFGIETPPRRCSRVSRACRCARSKAARPVAASAARFA